MKLLYGLLIVLFIFGIVLGKPLRLYDEDHNIEVEGVVTCNGQKMEDVEIELYEDGYTSRIDSIGETFTTADGSFILSGKSLNLDDFKPLIKIYHSCNLEDTCYKKFELMVPQHYFSSDKEPTEPYNFGTIELSRTYPGQKLRCL